MLLLVFKKGGQKVLGKHWVRASHSYLPPCILPGSSSVPPEQTGNAANALHLMHCTSNFPWGGFSDPGHFHGGDGTGHTKYHMKQKPRTTARERDRTLQRLHATSTYPLDVLHFLSSSTLRERVATSSGAVRRGWRGHAQKQGSTPRSPWKIFPPPAFF